MTPIAVALLTPFPLLLWRYRTSWWAALVATLYCLAAGWAAEVWTSDGLVTASEAEMLYGPVGLAWLVVLVTVLVARASSRRLRRRAIQTVVDAHPVPDTIPDWMGRATPECPWPCESPRVWPAKVPTSLM